MHLVLYQASLDCAHTLVCLLLFCVLILRFICVMFPLFLYLLLGSIPLCDVMVHFMGSFNWLWRAQITHQFCMCLLVFELMDSGKVSLPDMGECHPSHWGPKCSRGEGRRKSPSFLPHWWAGTSHLTSCPGTGIYTIGSPGTQAFKLRVDYSSFPASTVHTADWGPSPLSLLRAAWVWRPWMLPERLLSDRMSTDHRARGRVSLPHGSVWGLDKTSRSHGETECPDVLHKPHNRAFACCTACLLSLLFLYTRVSHWPLKVICGHWTSSL